MSKHDEHRCKEAFRILKVISEGEFDYRSEAIRRDLARRFLEQRYPSDATNPRP